MNDEKNKEKKKKYAYFLQSIKEAIAFIFIDVIWAFLKFIFRAIISAIKHFID